MAQIILNRQYTTRDGRPARVVAVNAAGAFPVVALVMQDDGTETPGVYDAAGVTGGLSVSPGTLGTLGKGVGVPSIGGSGGSVDDLVPAVVAHSRALNFYADGRVYAYDTLGEANKGVDLGARVACVVVSFNEGDGL